MKRRFKQVIFGLIIISMGIFLIPMSALAEAVDSEIAIIDSEQIMKLDQGQILNLAGSSPEISINSVHSGDYWYEDIVGGVKIVSYAGSGGKIDIPATIDGKSVLEIGANAFNGINTLTGVNLPNSVIVLGLGSFYNCPNLDSVYLGNGLISIGNGSFWGAQALTSIIIPHTVASIGYAAFANCNDLTKITILNPSISFGGDVFGMTPDLTIYGYSGSTAESYAAANTRPFVTLPAAYVDVYYSTHVQNVGWQASKKNGEISGTVGQGLRLEGIQIMVVPKDSAAPGSTAFPFMSSLN